MPSSRWLTHPIEEVKAAVVIVVGEDRVKAARASCAASDDDTMLHAERKASPFCTGRTIVVNEPEESAGPDVVGRQEL
jgi:hypothetical protein